MSAQAPGTVPDDVPRLGPGSIVLTVGFVCAFCASAPILRYRYGAADPAAGYLPFGPLVLLAIACWGVAPLARKFLGRSEKFVRAALLFYAVATTLGGFSTQFTVLQIPPGHHLPALLRPMFLGLVLGGAVTQALWMVIDVMMGMRV